MISIFYFIGYLACYTINFTILYEGIDKKASQKSTKFLISKILDEYNKIFTSLNLEFKLDSIISFYDYSKMTEYKNFSNLVGENNIKLKVDALENIKKNLVIIQSIKGLKKERSNKLSFCNGRYFFNIKEIKNLEGMLESSIYAIKDWINDSMRLDLPDFYELENYKDDISQTPIDNLISGCEKKFKEKTIKNEKFNRTKLERPFDRPIIDISTADDDLRFFENLKNQRNSKLPKKFLIPR